MPWPVTRPIRADASWIAVISGYENNIVHSIPNRKCAPTCEYVAMPLGSSSEAPVTIPGPNSLSTRLMRETGEFEGGSPDTVFCAGVVPPLSAIVALVSLNIGRLWGSVENDDPHYPALI